jgi:hypothetical protein
MAQEAVTLNEGEAAPFDGVLLTAEDAARLLTDAQTCEGECDLKLEEAQATYDVNLDFERRRTELQIDYVEQEGEIKLAACQAKLDFMDKEFNKATKPTPFKDPALAFSMGMVTTAVVVALTALSVHELQLQ